MEILILADIHYTIVEQILTTVLDYTVCSLDAEDKASCSVARYLGIVSNATCRFSREV